MNITSDFFFKPGQPADRIAIQGAPSMGQITRSGAIALRILFLLIVVAAFSQWGLATTDVMDCEAGVSSSSPYGGSVPGGLVQEGLPQGHNTAVWGPSPDLQAPGATLGTSCSVTNNYFPFSTFNGQDGQGDVEPFTTTGSYTDWSSASSPNSLHAEVSVDITDSPKQYFGYDKSGNPQVVNNPLAELYTADAGVDSSDVVTVNGPAGSPIELKITASFDGTASHNQCALGMDSSAVAFFDISSVQGSSFSFVPTRMAADACIGTLPGTVSSPYSEIVSVQPGTQMDVIGELGAAVTVGYGWIPQAFYPEGPVFVQDMEGSANASNTANLYIDPLTPGAYVTSDSGADYSTPASSATPEPGSLILLGTGLAAAALLLLLRRQKEESRLRA